MSDMIQTRRDHPPKQDWLLQQQPSALINAVEFCERDDACRQLAQFDNVTSYVNVASRTFVTAPAARVLLNDASYPTSGLPIANDKVTGERITIEKMISTGASNWSRWLLVTEELLQMHELESKAVPSAAAKLRVDRLTRIQAALGLPIQALAETLGITRQGLYKWLDATKEITLQEASRQRLAVVERLTKLWSERSEAPLGSMVHEPVAGGRTVFQMLTDKALDESAITRAFDELAEKLKVKPKSLSQRMAEAGFKRRPSARSLPADE